MTEINTAPVLSTIASGLTVQRIEKEAAPPVMSEFGSLSLGPGHVPGVGPVIHIAVHHPDGTTLAATLGLDAIIELATKYNAAAGAINTGGYRQPETRQ